jgi:uncharacterized YccA/Bax inhibitor family protein
MARNSNPVFKSASFQEQLKAGTAANAFETPSTGSLEDMYAQRPAGNTMSMQDVLNKVLIMALGVLAGGLVGWVAVTRLAASGSSMSVLMGLAGGAGIAALVIGLINQFRREASPVLSMLYSVLEGFLLGTLTAVLEIVYPGIALQAVLGTAAVFTVVMLGYRSGKFRTSPKARRIVMIVSLSFVGFLLINWVLSFFGAGFNTYSGWIGVVIGLVGIGLGAFFLVSDFEDIQHAVENGAPKSFAWRCAFGLVLSIIWIYVEMLRLIASLRSLAD